MLSMLRFRAAFMLRFRDASCYIGTAVGALSTAATATAACGNVVVGNMNVVQAAACGNAGSADGCLWQRWRGLYTYTYIHIPLGVFALAAGRTART